MKAMYIYSDIHPVALLNEKLSKHQACQNYKWWANTQILFVVNTMLMCLFDKYTQRANDASFINSRTVHLRSNMRTSTFSIWPGIIFQFHPSFRPCPSTFFIIKNKAQLCRGGLHNTEHLMFSTEVKRSGETQRKSWVLFVSP